jgi:uncharacterized membrane protein YkoI
MHRIGRAVIIALSVITLVPALAEGPARRTHVAAADEHSCLTHKERQATSQSGKVIPLAAAMRLAKKRLAGSVIRARLCRSNHGLVYVLTVLPRNGKVARLTVDASKGTLVGNR